jgi:polyisoprenoid-binding protein YceI
MKRVWFCLVLLSLALTGCPATNPSGVDGAGAGNGGQQGPTSVDSDADSAPDIPEPASSGTSGPVSEDPSATDELTVLSPDNTTIQFVGTHKGDKPDPRTGKFEDFSGAATVSDGMLTSVSVEIQTGSLSTDIEKLTTHLKSPDFFDVRQHPQAKFQSTSIKDDGDGKVTIAGDLTLLGKTQPISFPATVATAGGLTLDAEFTIDRTEFGMNFGTDNVEPAVTMTIKVTK